MSLTLHFHPLSSFCHKVLIALYENGTPFTPKLVDLVDEGERAAFRKLWPIGKFPVLRDEARGETVPESSVIIEYLDQHYPGKTRFIPADARAGARDAIARPLLRPASPSARCRRSSATGCGPRARRTRMASRKRARDGRYGARHGRAGDGQPRTTWAMGEAFTIADCAAAPALFYADKIAPFAGTHPNVAAYLDRLKQRPSYARVLQEAEPYLQFFPKE